MEHFYAITGLLLASLSLLQAQVSLFKKSRRNVSFLSLSCGRELLTQPPYLYAYANREECGSGRFL